MKQLPLLIASALLMLVSCNCDKTIKVACIGDSITDGHGISIPSVKGYPVVLNNILGDNYIVQNCGKSGTTMQKKSDSPYWNTKEFGNAMALKADIVVIKLGTNDTKPQNWNATQFKADYQALIDTLNSGTRHPKIYVCTPAPAFSAGWGINDSIITSGVVPIVKEIAQTNNLEVIDLYSAFYGKEQYFIVDGIHPDDNGAAYMAKVVAEHITK